MRIATTTGGRRGLGANSIAPGPVETELGGGGMIRGDARCSTTSS